MKFLLIRFISFPMWCVTVLGFELVLEEGEKQSVGVINGL